MGEYLAGKRAYLSGAIEFDSDSSWRIEPSRILVEEFKVDLFDPFNDPKQQWVPALKLARQQKDYDKMATIADNFVRKDLTVVDHSDFLVAHLPRGVPTTGTVHEIIVKANSKKPVLIVCPQGKEWVPFWYWGFVPHSQMFGRWEDLYQYLREVNDLKHTDNYRWDYVCGLI